MPDERPKYRIWAMHCPFNKHGNPVVGSFGRTIEPVVIIPIKTWTRLCNDVEAIKTTQFEVGTLSAVVDEPGAPSEKAGQP